MEGTLKVFAERLIITFLVIAAVSLLLVFAHSHLVQPLIILITSALSAIALWEFARLAKQKGVSVSSPLLAILGALTTASFGMHLFHWTFLLAAFLLFLLHFKRIEGAIVDLGVSLFGLVYIALPLGMLLALLYSSKGDGRFWIIYLLAVTKSADIAAYMGGNLWGKKKLAPQISPSKTLVGALCGLTASVLASFVLSPFGSLHSHQWIGLGITLGCVSIFGDLSESLLKRDAGIKDSGTIPGIGGVLDLLDSLLFAIPIVYFTSS